MNAAVMKQAPVNGIETETLGATVQAIRDEPELGKAHFRVSNKWLSGNQNRSTVSDFYGAKQEIAHKQNYELLADEPPILAGNDDGPNPVEYLLHALASCVTTSLVAHAAVRGIRIEEVESQVEGDIDLRGYLGLAREVPKGYTDIRVNFKIRAPGTSPERLKQLSMFSPVFNTITNGAKVDIHVETE
jgi:uncharacterized OsmC-like protein